MSGFISKYFLAAALFLTALTTPAFSAEQTLTEVAAPKGVIVQQSIAWVKKHLALSAVQIETLVKKGQELEARAANLSEPQLSDGLNKLFSEQQIAGVQVINRHDPLYWLYKERFGLIGANAAASPTQFPAWLTRRGRNWHIYLASNLSAAPIKRGDEIIFDSGEPYSFVSGTDAQATSKKVQVRSLAHEKAVPCDIALAMKSPGQMLLEIVQTNTRLIPLSSAGASGSNAARGAGYLPMPTSDLSALREAYIHALNGFEKTTDTLIIDLRGPYGEGGLSGIDLFLSDKGTRVHFTKKLVALVDRYTSGGREALAAMLQRHAGAILVGEQTAGLSSPVSVEDLDPGRFLLITVQEGRKGEFGPLVPDYKVSESITYVAGRDDVLAQALNVAAAAK